MMRTMAKSSPPSQKDDITPALRISAPSTSSSQKSWGPKDAGRKDWRGETDSQSLLHVAPRSSRQPNTAKRKEEQNQHRPQRDGPFPYRPAGGTKTPAALEATLATVSDTREERRHLVELQLV